MSDEAPGLTRAPVGWRWWDALVVYALWTFTGAFVILALSGVLDDSTGASGVRITIVLALLPPTLLGYLRLRALPGVGGSAVRAVWGPRRPGLADVVAGVGHGVVAVIAIQFLLGWVVTALLEAFDRSVPEIQEGSQEIITSAGALPLLGVVAFVVLAPVGEELLYRGTLFQALEDRLPAWGAIVLTGLLFGVAHGEPFVILLTTPFGMYLAWLTRRRGTLVTPIVAHGVFNLLATVLIRLEG